MDTSEQQLSKNVAAKVRPAYLKLLKRGTDTTLAYEQAYDEAVTLVAQAQHTSTDKARFASRDVLQEVMALVTK
jgi:hypothetical protein